MRWVQTYTQSSKAKPNKKTYQEESHGNRSGVLGAWLDNINMKTTSTTSSKVTQRTIEGINLKNIFITYIYQRYQISITY